jgi:hypothetical protein
MATLFDTLMKPKQLGAPPSDEGVLQSIAAVKKAPGMTESELGAGLAKAEGEKELAAGQRIAAKESMLGQQGLAEQSLEAQKAESARQIALQRLADKNDQRLAALNSDVANAISAESRQFKTDSANRKYMNQTMLDQYATEQIVNAEALNGYVQNKEMVMQRKVQLMDAYSKQIQQALEQGFLKQKGDLDQVSREKLARIAAAFEKKKADAVKKAQKNSVMKTVITGAFTAVGAVVGGWFTAGTGAAAGAAAGAGVAAGAGATAGAEASAAGAGVAAGAGATVVFAGATGATGATAGAAGA